MQLEPVQKLARDIKAAAITLSTDEARFLVDAYYQMQDNRIRADGQIRSMGDEPHDVLSWLSVQSRVLENQVKSALDAYSMSSEVGVWSRSVTGIGPVIAAGLMAHIDITQAPTVGHIWSFAGLDPTKKWEKKTKRPWNAALKVVCWKIGESFVKVSGNENAVYGHIYLARKQLEVERNEAGLFADQAEAKLKTCRIGKDTDAYKAYSAGKLPPAHLHSRAKRYAVKLFLSHWHEVAYKVHYHADPPNPYPIAMLGHAHKIDPQ